MGHPFVCINENRVIYFYLCKAIKKADKHFAIFVAQYTDESLHGFIEISIREDILKGCIRKQIGYIEGLYVNPEVRGLGLGRLLI